MSARVELKILLAKECTTLKALAQKMCKIAGKNITADSLSQKLRKGTLRYDEMEKIASALNYVIKFEKQK